jgi:hypothetical protein
MLNPLTLVYIIEKMKSRNVDNGISLANTNIIINPLIGMRFPIEMPINANAKEGG